MISYFSSSFSSVIDSYLSPILNTLYLLATLVCVVFLVNAGFHYITSSGQPEKLARAKKIIRDSLIGLTIVLSATAITALLSHAYTSGSSPSLSSLPNLGNIKTDSASFSLIDVIVKAITGLINYLIQSIAKPIISALRYFTSGTPLMAANISVFKLWLGLVAMADSLFVLVVCLLGFHVMGASSLGFEELDLRQLLPRLAFGFVTINTSIFIIDAVISLSNTMISALYAGFGSLNVWSVLTAIVNQSAVYGLAALIIMLVFMVLAFILLIYYVGRIVTLYLGAVLAPMIILLWLVPSFQDFAISAIKTYITTIFVLFVHVVILILAGSLLASLISNNGSSSSIMSLVVGISTLIALIKTQGVMNQFNYVSIGPKMIRRLSSQFIGALSQSISG